eukprot:SAG11_NODE_2161_length_3729_cov_1.948209_2_plen_120_part_00
MWACTIWKCIVVAMRHVSPIPQASRMGVVATNRQADKISHWTAWICRIHLSLANLSQKVLPVVERVAKMHDSAIWWDECHAPDGPIGTRNSEHPKDGDRWISERMSRSVVRLTNKPRTI